MKKHLTLSFSLLTTIIMSQTSTNWLTNGNNTSGSSYFGTNNNNPIIFKANGSEVFRLRPTGDVKIMQFDDNLYHGVVLTNKNGVLQKLNFGTSSQVLLGDGTWGTLPASRLSASCFSLAPCWTMGGDNFSTSLGVTEASIGTCNNYDFIIKANNTNSMWFKPDGTIGFGTNIPSNTGGKEFKFNDGALRLSGTNTYGGPMLVFDGGVSPYGDWGIEYAPSAFTKPGLNFWKPFGSSNANNYLLFLADDGMVGVGTANPSSRLTVDAWNDNGLTIQTVNTKKAISTYNKTTNKETFVVNADGKTIIGSAPATTDTMLVVNGTLKANDLNVNGTFSTSKLKLGTIGSDDLGLGLTVLASGARVLSLGAIRPFELSTTCIKPYTGILTSISERLIITKGTTATSNIFDFTNDGSNGYLDYGYDISLHPRLIDTTGAPVAVAPVPSLKINSVCNGDVEIAKGGGFVSTGNYLEVGNPIRNGSVVSNIYGAGGRVAQRITKKSFYPASYTGVTNEYNTQLFVNRNFVKALSVFNTVGSTTGDETFTLFGDGKIQLNTFNHSNKYFVINDFESPRTNNESFIVYGNGKTEINAFSPLNKCFVVNDATYPDSPKETFVVNGEGKTFIGKGRPMAGGPSANAMLTVDGLILAKEMRVAITSIHWADYVFDKGYKLTPLNELEAYINANKHLPEIPTTEQVKTDGVNIAEMNVLLLKKTEELTLYLIEQNKRLEALEKENELIKAKLNNK